MWILAEEVGFLRHVISEEGIVVDPTKVITVTNWVAPTTVGETRSFLGLAGYYRRFIENFSKIAKPMTELLKKDTKFIWTEECEASFQELEKRLVTSPVFCQIRARITRCIATLHVEDLEQCLCRRGELFRMLHDILNPMSSVMPHMIWS